MISRTFGLFRRDFGKYVAIFLVMEVIIGALNAVVSYYVVLPPLVPGATLLQFFNWLPGFLRAIVTLVSLLALVSLIFGTIASGTATKMTSEILQNREPDLGAGVRLAVSKLLSIWAVSLITGIIVILGLIALIVPGIILAIMFSLAIPVLLIENTGVLQSMSRSRELVGGRWLKSLGVYIVIVIIIAVLGAIANLITLPIGAGSVRSIVNSLISALYMPILPIGLTVYYYSNAARITSPTKTSTRSVPPAPNS